MSGFDSALDFDDDSELNKRSWRNAVLSDWQIRLGQGTYQVHRADLAEGERRSEFFFALFQRWEGNASTTDLTDLLPSECWSVFEQVLDFMYEGTVAPVPSTAVLLFKSAHLLQMRALARLTVEYLKHNLTEESAPIILLHSLALSPGLDGFITEAVATMAACFNGYPATQFQALPSESLKQILSHNDLQADAKHISNAVAAVVRDARRNAMEVAVFDDLMRFVKYVEPEDALLFFAVSVQLERLDLKGQCFGVAVEHFDKVTVEDVSLIRDHATVVELFDSNELGALDEDQVFSAISQYVATASGLSTDQIEAVWSTCRLSYLSLALLTGPVTQVVEIPAENLRRALTARLVYGEQGMAAFSEHVSQYTESYRFHPRWPQTQESRTAASRKRRRSMDMSAVRRIKVTNLVRNLPAEDLKEAFEHAAGQISRCWIDAAPRTAYIEFVSSHSAREAVQLFDRGDLNGRRILCTLDPP